jgi:hypothetical protein
VTLTPDTPRPVVRGIEKNVRQYSSAMFRLAMELWNANLDRPRARELMAKAHDIATTPEVVAFTAQWLQKHR